MTKAIEIEHVNGAPVTVQHDAGIANVEMTNIVWEIDAESEEEHAEIQETLPSKLYCLIFLQHGDDVMEVLLDQVSEKYGFLIRSCEVECHLKEIELPTEGNA